MNNLKINYVHFYLFYFEVACLLPLNEVFFETVLDTLLNLNSVDLVSELASLSEPLAAGMEVES
jgi:hypothetical protein